MYFFSNLIKVNTKTANATKGRRKKKATQPFSALFIATDEAGRCATFCLSKTKSLEEVRDHMEELKNRSGPPSCTYSGTTVMEIHFLLAI